VNVDTIPFSLFCHKTILLATHTTVCGVSCHTVLLEEERKTQRNKKRKEEGKNDIKKKGRKKGRKKEINKKARKKKQIFSSNQRGDKKMMS